MVLTATRGERCGWSWILLQSAPFSLPPAAHRCHACVTAFVIVVGVVRGWVSVELFCSAKLMCVLNVKQDTAEALLRPSCREKAWNYLLDRLIITQHAQDKVRRPLRRHSKRERLCLTLETCRGWQGRQQGPLHARMRS